MKFVVIFVTWTFCIHIDATTLIDGTNELVPKSENQLHEAQANLTKVAEDPDQRSEEPKANFCVGRQAPVHLNAYYF